MKIFKKLYIVLLFVLSISILSSCGLFGSKTTENKKTTANFDVKFNSLYPKVLKEFDKNFEPNMDESDFHNSIMYQIYLYTCKISTTYTETMINFNISESNAIGNLRDFLYLVIYSDQDLHSLHNYLSKLEGYGVTPHILANLLVDISMDVVDIAYDNNELIYEKYQKEVKALENNIRNLQQEQMYNYIINKFTKYTTSDDYKLIIHTINSPDFYNFNLYHTVRIMANDLINYGTITDDARKYYHGTNEVYQIFEDALMNAYQKDDTEFLEDLFLNTYLIENISRYNYELEIKLKSSNEKSLKALNQIIELYEEERDSLVFSIEEVFTYIINVNSAIDIELVEELFNFDPQYKSEKEFFVIKDEIIEVLKETLPSINDFEKMLLLTQVIHNFFIEIPIYQIHSHNINNMATIYHHTLKLFIEFIDAIDYDVYNDINNIATNIIQDNCDIDGILESEPICIHNDINMEKVVELILYFDEFFQEFKTKNSASFDVLKTFYEDEGFYYELEGILRSVIKFVVINYTDTPIIQLQAYLEDIYSTIRLVKEAQKIIFSLGINIYDELIKTKGAILLSFKEFSDAAIKEAPVSVVNDALEKFISDFVTYNNIIFNNLTEEQIKTVAKIYLNQQKQYFGYDFENLEVFNVFIEDLSIIISQFIHHLIMVEKEFINIIDENGFNLTEFENIDELDIEDSFNHHLIIALNEALDEETKDIIYQDFINYFEVVYEYSDIFEIPHEDIEEIGGVYLDNLQYIFYSITRIAQFDFNNLTPEELQYYQEFIDFIFANDEHIIEIPVEYHY